ncbi:MAG: OsmC family peroxiredoxin, partial [Phycisphaeraceae bacterium]
ASAYSFGSRFENGSGTNPDELLGAALAGCYSMALAHQLAESGHVADSVNTKAKVHLEKDDGGMSITRIELITRAIVPGIDAESFATVANDVKSACIISRALAVDISVDAELIR